jgi:ribosomal protein S18 acetylase RimI-like enzyme
VIVGFCWCTIVDRGVDKQGEANELYVEKEYRNSGIGSQLISAAKQLFIEEDINLAFVSVHHGHKVAVGRYEDAGFKEVDQLVMAFVP